MTRPERNERIKKETKPAAILLVCDLIDFERFMLSPGIRVEFLHLHRLSQDVIQSFFVYLVPKSRLLRIHWCFSDAVVCAVASQEEGPGSDCLSEPKKRESNISLITFCLMCLVWKYSFGPLLGFWGDNMNKYTSKVWEVNEIWAFVQRHRYQREEF